MYDLLICALPVSALNYAPAAPALLKSCVESAGFTAKTLDLSQEFYLKISQKDFLQYSQDSKFLLPNHEYNAISDLKVKEWLSQSIEIIKSINPKYIGLSIFSYYMQRSAYLLTKEIRLHCPTVKIILGGFGLTQASSSLKNLDNFKNTDLIKPFNQFMHEQGLVDHNIIGEGEDALVSLLQDNIPVVNSLDDLYNVPISDFSDYNLIDYEYVSQTMLLPITGSKGCVRQCTFCDIPNKFGKFRFRSGKHIAEEILYLKQKYKINNFSFTDSLINGSLKALKELLGELAKYNNSVPDSDRIRWNGQYISRPKGQTPEYLYELMAQSGAEGLTIGLESGSNAVLEAMNKKVKIEDVDYEMELFEKYNISTVLLFIIGFYNETYDNFLETIDTIIRYQKYVANGTVIRMDLGHPLTITNETALFDRSYDLGITMDLINPNLWTCKTNPELTLKERIRRRLIAQLVCDKLGIPTGASAYNLTGILNTLNG
jgi:tRNA A37 methylthiotransferase MiaB